MPRKKRAGKKAPARRPSAQDAPVFDLLKSLDEETLARVRDRLRAESQLMGEEEDDPLALFEDFLRILESFSEQSADDNDEFFDEVVVAMTQLSIDDNGGDPRARELKAAIYEMLDDAVGSGRLDAASLMLLAKVLNDSGWSVPDLLKSHLVNLLESAATAAPDSSPVDLGEALADIAEASEGDAFAAYDAINSVLAAFPSEIAARMVAALGEGRAPVLLHALAGFVMHRDPRLAMSAIDELKRAANAGLIESALVERMVRMRPWLPADRQPKLDEAIRALRFRAAAPIDLDRPSAAKFFVMASDGSGAGGALATLKARDGWRFVAAMTKTSGVEEVLSLEGLGKRQVDATLRGMRENVMAAQTDAVGVARYLELALGENLAAGTPPPFKLIAFAENLGLGPIAPRTLAPAALIAEMLAELPDAEKDGAAVERAHKAVVGGALEQPWFEAGEGVERLLGPVRGPKARAKTLLEVYLPQRREFWVRSCAWTAFVLQLDPKTYGGLGRSLALVGREIANGAPLEEIPLMRQIAEVTVGAYESRMLG